MKNLYSHFLALTSTCVLLAGCAELISPLVAPSKAPGTTQPTVTGQIQTAATPSAAGTAQTATAATTSPTATTSPSSPVEGTSTPSQVTAPPAPAISVKFDMLPWKEGVEVTTVLSGQRGFRDGKWGVAPLPKFWFFISSDLIADETGNLLVADDMHGAVRQLTPDGQVTTLFASEYSAKERADDLPDDLRATLCAVPGVCAWDPLEPKVPRTKEWTRINSVARDDSGAYYVLGSNISSDFNLDPELRPERFTVAKVSSSGEVTVLARKQTDLERGAFASYYGGRLVLGQDGSVYVVHPGLDHIGRITPDGMWTEVKPIGEDGAPVVLTNPRGLTRDREGNLYVAAGGPRLQGQFKGSKGQAIYKMGPDHRVRALTHVFGSEAEFEVKADDRPQFVKESGSHYDMVTPIIAVSSIAVGNGGEVFFSDRGTGIYMVKPDGAFYRVAGTHGEVGGDNGVGSLARFEWIVNIAKGPGQTLYVLESTSNQGEYHYWGSRLRKITY